MGICGGKPRVAGTRIRVQDIVIWTEQGESPEEIISEFPQLRIADVYDALAYYHDHRDEIEQHMKDAEELEATMRADPASQLPQTGVGKDANADSISP